MPGDKKHGLLPIDEKRLKEMKAMEDAEQRLIEDLFSTPSNKVTQNKHIMPTSGKKKAIIRKNPKSICDL